MKKYQGFPEKTMTEISLSDHNRSYHIDNDIVTLISLSIFPTIPVMVVKLSHLHYRYWLGCQCISVLPIIPPDQSPSHLAEVGDRGKERAIINIRSILRLLRY